MKIYFRQGFLFVAVVAVTVLAACGSFYTKRLSRHDTEDIQVVGKEIWAVVLVEDYLMRGSSLREKLVLDRYHNFEIIQQRFYLLKYPWPADSNEILKPSSVEQFYQTTNSARVSFKITASGKIIHGPVWNEMRNIVGNEPGLFKYSFANYDPILKKDTSPQFQEKDTIFIFNSPRDLLAVIGTSESAMLNINDVKSEPHCVYRFLNGEKKCDLEALPLEQNTYGLGQWGRLTADGKYFIIFLKKGWASKPVNWGKNALALTNNLCLIHNLETQEKTFIYSSNEVDSIENDNDRLLFFSKRPSENAQFSAVFDQEGRTIYSPSPSPLSFLEVSWQTASHSILLKSDPVQASKTSAQALFNLRIWNYAQNKILDQTFGWDNYK